MVCHALSLIIPSNGYHLTMQSIDDLTARWETKKYTQLETPKRKPGGGKKAYKRTVLIALCLKALIGSGSSNSWNGSFKISLVTYGFWNWAHELCACLREILLISYSRLPLCSSASPPPHLSLALYRYFPWQLELWFFLHICIHLVQCSRWMNNQRQKGQLEEKIVKTGSSQSCIYKI